MKRTLALETLESRVLLAAEFDGIDLDTSEANHRSFNAAINTDPTLSEQAIAHAKDWGPTAFYWSILLILKTYLSSALAHRGFHLKENMPYNSLLPNLKILPSLAFLINDVSIMLSSDIFKTLDLWHSKQKNPTFSKENCPHYPEILTENPDLHKYGKISAKILRFLGILYARTVDKTLAHNTVAFKLFPYGDRADALLKFLNYQNTYLPIKAFKWIGYHLVNNFFIMMLLGAIISTAGQESFNALARLVERQTTLPEHCKKQSSGTTIDEEAGHKTDL